MTSIKHFIGEAFGASIDGRPDAISQFSRVYVQQYLYLPCLFMPSDEELAQAFLYAMPRSPSESPMRRKDEAIVWRIFPEAVLRPDVPPTPAGQSFSGEAEPRRYGGIYGYMRYHLMPVEQAK